MLDKRKNDRDVVCLCFDVTRGEVNRHFAVPGNNYDTLVRETKVGTKCTACLLDLDLIVHQASGQNAVAKITVDSRPEAAGRGFKLPIDQCNSGFFINRDGIETSIHAVNYGPMFGAHPSGVAFSYVLDLMSEHGKRVKRHKGKIPLNGEAHIDLSAFPETPPEGWFLFTLLPAREGLMGSIRPQISIMGPNWVASYHPQYHSYACRGRAVLAQRAGGTFHTEVNMINAAADTTKVVFEATSVESDYRGRFERTLGGYCSATQDLDEAFADAPEGQAIACSVLSDRPIRKHVVNRLSDGSISIDHFPNFK